MEHQLTLLTQMTTKTNSAKSSPVAPRHHETVTEQTTVPFSTRIKSYVLDELVAAADGVGTGAAMGRKVLTDWADARRR